MLAWSLSRLQNLETCPRKFAAEVIHKTVKYTESPEQAEGNRNHKAIEVYVKKRIPLPRDLLSHKRHIDRLVKAGKCRAEKKIAIDRNCRSVKFYDPTVWGRGVIDLEVLLPDRRGMIIVDWKFGKPKEDTSQLDLMATLSFTLNEKIQYILAMFYWAKNRFLTTEEYTRDQLPRLWQEFNARVKNYEMTIERGEFPPKPSGLCRKHCDVMGCEYYQKGL